MSSLHADCAMAPLHTSAQSLTQHPHTANAHNCNYERAPLHVPLAAHTEPQTPTCHSSPALSDQNNEGPFFDSSPRSLQSVIHEHCNSPCRNIMGTIEEEANLGSHKYTNTYAGRSHHYPPSLTSSRLGKWKQLDFHSQMQSNEKIFSRGSE